MAQSADGSDEIELCEIAVDAAFEKGFSDYCSTTESRLEVLGRVVGLEAADVDPEATLSAGPGTDPRQQREWVLARAEELIADGREEPLDAINRAWAEVGDPVDADAPTDDGGTEDDDPGEEEEAEAAASNVEEGPDHDDGDDGEDQDEDAEDEAGEGDAPLDEETEPAEALDV